MCLSCGCDDPVAKIDPTSIDVADLAAAAENAGITLRQAAENILVGVVQMTAGATKAEGVSGMVVKAEAARRYTLTVAYPAMKADVAVAQDGHRDFASPAAVEEAAWGYCHKSPRVGLWHKDGTDGAGDVVESYIYRGPDWTIKAVDGSEQVIKAGDWLLGIRWTAETWPLVEKGLIGGVSPQGRAKRKQPAAGAVASLRS